MLHDSNQFIVVTVLYLSVIPISHADSCTSLFSSSTCESSWFCSSPYYFYTPTNRAICEANCAASCVHGCGFASNGACATCNKFCSGYCLVSASTACIASCAAGTSSAPCNGKPGCKWCSAFGGYCTASASCISSCSAANSDSSLCSDTAGNCAWCSGFGGYCRDVSAASSCITSCPLGTSSGSCEAAPPCSWCSGIGGYCKQNSVVGGCPASCAAITAQTECSGILPCGWCSSLGGYCKQDSAVPSCVSDCTVLSNAVCTAVAPCGWCAQLNGYCKQNSAVPTCVADCSVVGPAACAAVPPCGWCAVLGGYCRATAHVASCIADCTTYPSTPCAAGYVAPCAWCSDLGGYCKQTSLVATCVSDCRTFTPSLCQQGTVVPCSWCSELGGYCKQSAVVQTCISSCPGTAASPTGSTICTAVAPCHWCDASAGVGVCQPQALQCFGECLPYSTAATTNECSASQKCRWCGTLNYCYERTVACHEQCATVGPFRPAICSVSSISCSWCDALQYCVGSSDPVVYRCASHCEALWTRPDLCSNASHCHWCATHRGRCKPLVGYGTAAVRWRGEAECETPSSTNSASAVWSTTGSVSSATSYSGSFNLSLSNTVSGTATTMSSTSTNTSSASHTLTDTVTISHSLSSSRSSSASGSSADSPSESGSHSRHSQSRSSPSLSTTFHAPPCNAAHIEVLHLLWPMYFNITTNYMSIATDGIPNVSLTPALTPALIYRIPLLLRHEFFVGHPSPVASSHNNLGFRQYGSVPVTLKWENRTTLTVGMPPLPRYTIDSDEEALIEVPFEAIVYCNRTDPSSVPGIPSMLAIVSVTVKARYRVLSEFVAGSVLLAVAGGAVVSPTSSSSSTLRSVASFAECGEDENSVDLSGVFTLPLGDEPVEAALGAVLGNTAATVAVGVVLVIAAALLRFQGTESLMTVALSRVHLPSATIVPLAGLIANNVSSAIFLVFALVSRDTTPVSPATAIVCVFVVALLLVAHYYLLMSVCLQPLLTAVRREHAPPHRLRDVGVFTFLKSRWLHLRRRQWRWEPSASSSIDRADIVDRRNKAVLWKWRHLITLQDTHIGWYPLLDGAVNAAAAVLSTVPWMVGNACFPSALSLALVQSAQLAVVVAWRPHSSLFMHYFTCVATVLSCVTLLLSAWKGYLYQQLAQPPGENSAEVVNLSSAVVVLIACNAALNIFKGFLDFIDVVVAVTKLVACRADCGTSPPKDVKGVSVIDNYFDKFYDNSLNSASNVSEALPTKHEIDLELLSLLLDGSSDPGHEDEGVAIAEREVTVDDACVLDDCSTVVDIDNCDALLPLRNAAAGGRERQNTIMSFSPRGFSIAKALQDFPVNFKV